MRGRLERQSRLSVPPPPWPLTSLDTLLYGTAPHGSQCLAVDLISQAGIATCTRWHTPLALLPNYVAILVQLTAGQTPLSLLPPRVDHGNGYIRHSSLQSKTVIFEASLRQKKRPPMNNTGKTRSKRAREQNGMRARDAVRRGRQQTGTRWTDNHRI